jgi:Ca2+-binding EF-hand superfamily protein
MRLLVRIGLTAVLWSAAGAVDAQAQMRFRGMDANGDGIITRDEWRGNDRAFQNQDWNNDGILSGDEVRPGARRPQNLANDWNRDGRFDNLDVAIARQFEGLDRNNDGRIAESEWTGDRRAFLRLDANGDRHVTVREYAMGGTLLDSQGGPAGTFANVDGNSDGWLTRDEWRFSRADFDRLDTNNDNRISRFEFDSPARQGGAAPIQSTDRFAAVDSNRDGYLTRSEWRGTERTFTLLDRNRDNRLTRAEYDAIVQDRQSNPASHSTSWRIGYDRGIAEGRVAGREDAQSGHGWDLEGQRELEGADSGYDAKHGARSEYQAGYREGFRNAYRAGFLESR